MALNAHVMDDIGNFRSSADGAATRPSKVPYTVDRYEMADLLKVCIEQKASDLHLAVGRPPVLRINGALRDLTGANLTPPNAAG